MKSDDCAALSRMGQLGQKRVGVVGLAANDSLVARASVVVEVDARHPAVNARPIVINAA